jgi:hypothetical protein
MRKFIILFIAISLGCSSKDQPSEVLVKANEIHLEALKIQKEIQKELDSLKNIPEWSIKADSLDKVLKSWEASLVEIEGFEHEGHNHEHNHEHNHDHSQKMSDEEMLDYQTNAKNALLDLKKGLDELKLSNL